MKNEDKALQNVMSWYSIALLSLLPIPLWFMGLLSSPVLVSTTFLVMFLAATNFFHLFEGYIGPKNFVSMLRIWFGDRKAKVSWKMVPYEKAEASITDYIREPGKSIPCSISFLLLIFSIFTFIPLSMVVIMYTPYGIISGFAILILYVVLHNHIKNKVIPPIALAFYQHLSQGGIFFKLSNIYILLFVLTSPFIIMFPPDEISFLEWMGDIFILSFFGVFVDFSFSMADRYGSAGRLGGLGSILIGVAVSWNQLLLNLVFVLIEGSLIITGARKLEKRSGRANSFSHFLIMAMVAAALVLSSEILALLTAFLIFGHMVANTIYIARKKPDVLLC